jgi:hypothetical protein
VPPEIDGPWRSGIRIGDEILAAAQSPMLGAIRTFPVFLAGAEMKPGVTSITMRVSALPGMESRHRVRDANAATPEEWRLRLGRKLWRIGRWGCFCVGHAPGGWFNRSWHRWDRLAIPPIVVDRIARRQPEAMDFADNGVA